MADEPAKDVTRLLHAWSQGDDGALASLMPLVYDELHRSAHFHMVREAPDNTLQTTALVNEVYLRLVGGQPVPVNDRAHFLAICATMMRRILTDFARARKSQKRGGPAPHVPLDEEILVSNTPRVDLLALDDALKALAAGGERKAWGRRLGFFGGIDGKEKGRAMGGC